MSYQLLNNDLVEIQIVGLLHGQETRNVFHYYVATNTPASDGRAALQIALADFMVRVYQPILAFQSQEWECQGLTIQKIAPFRYRLIKANPSDTSGDQAGSSLPSSSAAVVSRYGEAAGRAYQGRIFIPGVPVGYEENSTVNAAGMALLTVIADTLKESLIGGAGVALHPTLAHVGNAPIDQRVSEVHASNILRVQRRREVGRGS